METARIAVDVPKDIKLKMQLISARKGKKLSTEIAKWVTAYVKKNERFLEYKD